MAAVADLIERGRRRGAHPRQRPAGGQPAGEERDRCRRRAAGAAGLVRRPDPGHARLHADERARGRRSPVAASSAGPPRWSPAPSSTPTTRGFSQPDQADRPLPARGRGAPADGARRDLGGPRREGLAPRRRLARAAARSSTRPPSGRWSTPGTSWSPTAAAASRWSAMPTGCAASRRSSTRTSAPRCWPRTVDADVLVIATDVSQRRAALRHARGRGPIGRVTVAELRGYAADGPLRQRLDGPQGRRGLPVRRARRRARRHHQPRPHRRRGAGEAGTVVVPD